MLEAAMLDKEISSLLPPGEGARRADEGTQKRKRAALAEPSPGASRHPLPAGEGKNKSLSLVFAIPDHPWVDTTDGAAVRIAMTAAQAGNANAVLREVTDERDGEDGEVVVDLRERRGRMFADLKIGANVAGAHVLTSNSGLATQGVILVGEGFRLLPAQVVDLGFDLANLPAAIRPYQIGRDLMQRAEPRYVIDLNRETDQSARTTYPKLLNILIDTVKPDRDVNKDRQFREFWWKWGRSRPNFMSAVLPIKRYIATCRTATHRVFVFLDSPVVPDAKIIGIALEDALLLGVLQSACHVLWANASGAWLGVGNDSNYNHSECFDKFPFPTATPEQQTRIRDLAEQLDAHRKRQQAAHPDLTLTGIYNVLEKLRSGEELTTKERAIHEHGLVSVLRQLHDDLDAAVLEAYGWGDLLSVLRVAHGCDSPSPTGRGWREAPGEGTNSAGSRIAAVPSSAPPGHLLPTGEGIAKAKRAFDEAILERLVALNAERAAEEARGLVRWLRPEFQNPQAQAKPVQAEIDTSADADATPSAKPTAKPVPWPKDTVDQVRAIADLLAASATPLSLDDIAARFSARGPWKKRLPPLLDMLVALGRARERAGHYTGA